MTNLMIQAEGLRKRAQGGGGVGAQGVGEGAPQPLIGGEGLGGAAGCGERSHELAAQLLAQLLADGVRAGEVLELGDDVGGVA
jgi:hypothetical protein